MDPVGTWSWESLRDIVIAGFEAGGLRDAATRESLRDAAGELAAVALDIRRSRLEGA